eukprot:CAMPEP_0202870712 /NCGR_PEP_ID=MMETSP1391-20130828/16552_1 /ASSEMBLY_ACC=CAM_ASM_000867 /TAXON_ID=1034604 /ORGANISM="Chlamydomonas leiostraca, Strain SAG 11-49" /LENGTH=30 /DNA_ID= /DNA_START= /DNA_END= /DNA_ORIENTATION=
MAVTGAALHGTWLFEHCMHGMVDQVKGAAA